MKATGWRKQYEAAETNSVYWKQIEQIHKLTKAESLNVMNQNIQNSYKDSNEIA